jgi:hypothetical protein
MLPWVSRSWDPNGTQTSLMSISMSFASGESWEWVPEQMTPASSWWPQLWTDRPRWQHWPSEVSLPRHCTSSRKMLPMPSPKWLLPSAPVPSPQPSCWHTTCAALMLQRSSHTVPHVPLWWTSTRPSHRFLPSTNRTIGRSGEYSEVSGRQLILDFF